MTRATDLPIKARAFLDALAIGESGGADDNTAYSVLYGGTHFPLTASEENVTYWPTSFPIWNGVWIDGAPTHAAGRYQFEPATWRGLGGGSFDPVSQDHKAWELARQASGSLIMLNELNGSNNALAEIARVLHSTWTSLSPETFPARYRECLAKLIQVDTAR